MTHLPLDDPRYTQLDALDSVYLNDKGDYMMTFHIAGDEEMLVLNIAFKKGKTIDTFSARCQDFDGKGKEVYGLPFHAIANFVDAVRAMQ